MKNSKSDATNSYSYGMYRMRMGLLVEAYYRLSRDGDGSRLSGIIIDNTCFYKVALERTVRKQDPRLIINGTSSLIKS
jgi:hypothetical protein